TVVYGATWTGKAPQIYTTNPESPESRPLGFEDAGIFSVSKSGELAVALGCRLNWGQCIGTLARVPLAGGEPLSLLPSVIGADWEPDGKDLAVVWLKGEQCLLEFPKGNILYQSSGWMSFPRTSPKGDLVAFTDHPVLKDVSGSVCVVDLTRRKTTLSAGWTSL